MADTYKAYLIEENSFIREGLKVLLKKYSYFSSVHIISLEEINSKNDLQDCGLIILGAEELPIEDLLSSLDRLKSKYPHTHIVVLNSKLNMDSVTASFSAGADGYMLNNISAEGFLHSLDLIMIGEKVFPTAMASLLLKYKEHNIINDNVENQNNDYLSDREKDVLLGLERGESNKVIARQLGITEATVKVHVKAVLRKLKLKNRTQAAIWAMNNGIASTIAQ